MADLEDGTGEGGSHRGLPIDSEGLQALLQGAACNKLLVLWTDRVLSGSDKYKYKSAPVLPASQRSPCLARAGLDGRFAGTRVLAAADYGVVRPQRRTETKAMRHRPVFALPPDNTNKIAALVEYMEALQS